MSVLHDIPGPGIEILGPMEDGFDDILTVEALTLIAGLAREFGTRVQELLQLRKEAQARYDAGERPRFLPETAHIRQGDWKVAPLPDDLLDRRVEITGPVDRKMVINALNSGASCFMADFEDSTAPTWSNLIHGQINLRDAVAGTISYEHPTRGTYKVKANPATLLVRPRGWHLLEKHVLVDGEPVPGGLVDFALYFFHNAYAGKPYFYLPKLQSHLEARLWNEVFCYAQDVMGMDYGTIKATVLIETLPGAYEMEEILYELREHSSGLNCGRWDYIFSFIKTLNADPAFMLPDRSQVGMTAPFMKAYTTKVIQVCHRRGVHAMGGMAAQIPIKSDPDANLAALEKVRGDKLREVRDGHDGTWVAHPGLVPIAKAVFDEGMPGKNQLDKQIDAVITEADLLALPKGGTVTEQGVRHNIRVGVQYLEAWLGGNGCVPLYDLMEDAATAEISRTQVWQWLKHGAVLADGRPLTRALYASLRDAELADLRSLYGDARWSRGHFDLAGKLFDELSTAETLADFLTLPAYEHLLTIKE